MESTAKGLLDALSEKLGLKLFGDNENKAIDIINEWLNSQDPVYEYKVMNFRTEGDTHMGFADDHMGTWETRMNEMSAQGYTLHTYMEEGCIMHRRKRP